MAIIESEPRSSNGSSDGLDCLIAVARAHGLHFTKEQIVRDNLLKSEAVSVEELRSCCNKARLKMEVLDIKWPDLADLKKAIPAIVLLRDGKMLVLDAVDVDATTPTVRLLDPSIGEEYPLSIDRPRFESVWTGTIILIKRSYDIQDETQPFSLNLIATLMFRERRLVVDIGIAALAMSFLALTPIMFWRLLTDRVLPFYAYNTFTLLCLMMLVFIVFETAFGALRRHLLLRLTTRVDVKLWTYMFDKVLDLPIDYFESTPLGLITHKMGQMSRIRNFLTGQLFGTVLDAGVLIFFLPVMFYFSFTLTAIVLAMCALIAAWIVLMLPAYRRRSGATEAAEAQRGAFLSQTIHGMRTVKSLSLETKQRRDWDVMTAKVAKFRLAEGDLGNLIEAVVKPIERLMVSGVFALGVYMAMSTKDPVYIGSLFAFLMLSQRVAAPLMQAAQLIQQYDEARTAVGMVSSLVNQSPEEGRSGHGVKTSLKGHVNFSNVRFKYKGAINPALQSVTFEVPPGTTLGVMGRSGSGKTTITRLLQRLHSEYTGLIKIDGIDVREYDVDHLRASLGVVLQENFLFSGTIRENICAAKQGATFEQMVYAARLAGAEEFIDKLPSGYETFIYEGSPNLSGGQRQRLAIARALITDPKILILDEATSALDAESEAIVNANISRIAAGRTMIVISHRLSSLVKSDAILVLDRGEVHDIGRHAELLERCDIYAGLWHTQNSHEQGVPAHPTPRLVKGAADVA